MGQRRGVALQAEGASHGHCLLWLRSSEEASVLGEE